MTEKNILKIHAQNASSASRRLRTDIKNTR